MDEEGRKKTESARLGNGENGPDRSVNRLNYTMNIGHIGAVIKTAIFPF